MSQNDLKPTRPGKAPATKKAVAKIKIYPSTDGQFFSVIKAGNNKVFYTSETVKRKSTAIESAKKCWQDMQGDIEIKDETI